MNNRTLKYFLLALLIPAMSFSCKESSPAQIVPAAQAAQDNDEGYAAHAGEGHEEGAEAREPSDLDRPVEELVALTCEHKKITFECDECRYEVGFVRVPASLVEGGLVTTVKAERRKIAVPITLTGEVRFDERRVVHVSCQVEGIVNKVYVVLGDKVKKGQALVEIESVAFGEAQAAYLEAQGLFELARSSFERMSELRRENISSEKEYLQAKQEREAAEIRMEGALGKLTRLGMDTSEARALTSGTSRGCLMIRAPMDGAVLVIHAVSGEVTTTDESLVIVGDNTTVWVWADLYERDISIVNRGQAARKLAASVSVKAYPDEEFVGTVDLVSPAMDEASRTVKVRVQVKNTDGRLLSGMFATVKLFLPGTDEALAVPRDAVLEDEGRSFVFVHHQGDYYLRRPVVVGRTWTGWVEIIKGLQSAQTVVAEGAFIMKSDVLRSKMGAGCAD
ncbi:MAG: efflux RND transporter periplasmic adaptor subunit [Candidatus Krumholzibacteriia bacterium]